jgi:hypothetical protein
MYKIEFREDLNLLDIAWTASFTPEAVIAYASELKAHFAREGFQPGYKLRIDMRLSAVQPQQALPAFAQAFADFPKASRIAIVTPSTLAGMQVKRVMTQPYLRVFKRAEESMAWLLEDAA